jgi:hypothetical protein
MVSFFFKIHIKQQKKVIKPKCQPSHWKKKMKSSIITLIELSQHEFKDDNVYKAIKLDTSFKTEEKKITNSLIILFSTIKFYYCKLCSEKISHYLKLEASEAYVMSMKNLVATSE